MTQIIENKNIIENIIKNIDIKLSTFGFATYCDFCFCNRIQGTFPNNFILDHDILNKIKYGDKIFLNWEQKNFYLFELLQSLKQRKLKVFFLILHEPYLTYNDYMSILPFSLHLLTTNNWLDNPRVHNLPIGIRDGEEVFPSHKGFSQKPLLEYMNFNNNNNNNNNNNCTNLNSNKNILCLLCFTTYNWCAQDRNVCYDILHNKSFVENLNIQNFDSLELDLKYKDKNPSCCGRVPLKYNYEKTLESYFVLCPTGLGEATHRFFETILLGSIPIVKKTNFAFDKLYKLFPCLVVDDWNHVTEEYLLSKKDECYSYLNEFNKKYVNYYNNIDLLFDLVIEYL